VVWFEDNRVRGPLEGVDPRTGDHRYLRVLPWKVLLRAELPEASERTEEADQQRNSAVQDPEI
jgi:hypothetical protein